MPDFETWNLLIHAARASEAKDAAFSENCLRKALRFTEDLYGKESPETGLCLVELYTFLERKGGSDEVKQLSLRYQQIVSNYAQQHGLNKSA